MKEKKEYVTQAGLKKDYDWTQGQIKKFLPTPCKEAVNPNYVTGAPMKLFEVGKVKKVMETPDFLKSVEKLKKKRAGAKVGAKKAVETKVNKTRELLDKLDFTIPQYEKTQLYKLAVEHYNDLWQSKGRHEKTIHLHKDLDPNFLNRIAVNFLRHEMSDYDYAFDMLKGKTGKMDVIEDARTGLINAIYIKYPYLEYEDTRPETREDKINMAKDLRESYKSRK